jgi:Kef-type K+ transport system membrane component KefB
VERDRLTDEALEKRHGAARRARRSRHLLGYVAIVGVGVAVVLAVLPLGQAVDRAPTVPASLGVSGRAVDCFGGTLVARQSGIYLDLHRSGRGGTTENPVAGDRIGRGRIDRRTGQVEVSGSCASGTELAGHPYRADLDVATLANDPIGTQVVVGDEDSDVTLAATIEETTAASGGSTGSTGSEPLSGTELAGRAFLAAAMVILLARAMGSLFRRIGQPRVVGEIVAGILLGPSAVGAVFPGATDFLFPTEVIQVVAVLAQFGLIFFMFLTGLRLDLGALKGSSRVAVLVSHVSIVAPFVLGVGASLLLFPLLGDGEFASFALFMGAAMSITAFPVLARILSDTGLDRTRLGAVAITCAAVDDVSAWCVLSVVVAIAQASGADDVLRTACLAVAYAVALLYVVRPLLAWHLAPERRREDGLGNQTIAVLIALVLLGAWATEEIGIHAIFGAFLVGVAIPRHTGVVEALNAKLEGLTGLVLLPLFFVVAGISTRVGLLDTPLLWGITVFVIVLAIAGKWGGSTLAARACRMPWREAVPLGVLMNTRGLTEIVILTIGLDLGIISPALFTIMVIMALVTTVMTVPVLTKLGVVPAVVDVPVTADDIEIAGTDEHVDEPKLIPAGP